MEVSYSYIEYDFLNLLRNENPKLKDEWSVHETLPILLSLQHAALM